MSDIKKASASKTVKTVRENHAVLVQVAGGPVGPKGDPNAGVFVKGVVDAGTWPPVSAPNVGDLYVFGPIIPPGAPAWAAPGKGAFYDHNGVWVDAGLLRGPIGPRGEPGPPLNVKGEALAWAPDASPKGGDIWTLPDPLPAGTPAGFKPGGAAAWDDVAHMWIPLEAIRGPAGHSITVYGPSNTPPTGVPLYKGDMWLADDPAVFAESFDPRGVKVIPGPPGPVGPIGQSAYEVWKLTVSRPTAPIADFLAAIKGAVGEKGDKGDAGQSLTVSGFLDSYGELPGVTTSVDTDGDGTADSGTNAKPAPTPLTVFMLKGGELWVYDPASTSKDANGYVNLGKIAGPPGRAAHITPEVATVADLPAAGSEGQMVHVVDTHSIYGWDSEKDNGSGGKGAWVNGGHLGGSSGGLDPGTVQGAMLRWDTTAGAWVPGDPSAVVPEGTTEGQTIVWDAANAKYRVGAPLLANLSDCKELSTATDGQVPVWNTTNSRWEPADPASASPIIYLGSGAWVAADVADPAKLHGMAVDTVPSPTDYPPLPGDQYIDLATGVVTAFTGAPGAAPPKSRTAAAITAGASPVDAVPSNIGELGDVVIAVPSAGELLTYDDQAGAWKNSPPYQNYVNLKMEQLALGLASTLPLISKQDDPPTWAEASNKYYLVGENPTGDWAGHANEIAFYVIQSGGGYAWHFHGPIVNETHFIESENAEYRWTGTAWEVAHDAGVATTQYVDQKHAETTTTLASYATQNYVDTLIGQITTGLAHKVAVEAIANTPPTGPVAVGDHYIVGTAPTGDWAGHANKVTVWGVGMTPAWTFESPHVNDSHFVESVRKTYTWNGSLWVVVSESTTANNPGELWMVGDIKQSILTETQFINHLPEAERFKWCLADGRNVTGSAWAATTGQDTVPDLRGAYLRMAGQNTNASWNGGTLNSYQEDSTARPKTSFAGTTNNTGNHRHRLDRMAGGFSGEWASTNLASANGNKNYPYTDYQGNHTHTVTINGGGDTETRPKTYSVNYYVKIN